jgi:hypothetical protein
MALILSNKISKIEKDRNSVHKEVECTYTSFTDNEGHKNCIPMVQVQEKLKIKQANQSNWIKNRLKS